jgi:hypothetical protein
MAFLSVGPEERLAQMQPVIEATMTVCGAADTVLVIFVIKCNFPVQISRRKYVDDLTERTVACG